MKAAMIWSAALVLVFTLVASGTQAEEWPTPVYQNVSVHDPSIIRAEDGLYYIFGSHMAAARSADLMQWELISRNAKAGCTLFEDVQTELKECLTWAQTDTFWAPDVERLKDGRYYFYYCACKGDSPLSAMGVAAADAPEGPYEDLGLMLKSGAPGYDATRLPNVVDPQVFHDKEGRLWMVYGSYSGGIFILEMDEETGFPHPDQGYGKKLLGKNHSRIEGPYILYSPDTDYYYLFLSFGGLGARDGYNIRVSRSKNPDGPYEDALGQPMIEAGGKPGTFFNDVDYEGYGLKLMGGYGFVPAQAGAGLYYRSPGHNSAYYDAETGRYFLVFHTRFATGGESHSVRVHQFFFDEHGWPLVLPLRYGGESPRGAEEGQVAGDYQILFHGQDINKKEHLSQLCSLNQDGSITGELSGSWESGDGRRIVLTIDGHSYTGIVQIAYDEAQAGWLPCLTALDERGQSLWGIRVKDKEP